MRMKLNKFIFYFVLSVIASLPIKLSAEETVSENPALPVVKSRPSEDTVPMLNSIIGLQHKLSERIKYKNELLKNTKSDAEIIKFKSEIKKLEKQYSKSSADFERIATGVDTGIFHDEKASRFNWKEELISLIKPAVAELKNVTKKARQKSKIKEEISYYEGLLPAAESASKNIDYLKTISPEGEIKSKLNSLSKEWNGIEGQLRNSLEISRMQLASMEKKEKSFVESTSNSTKKFFKTRGKTLIIAVAAFFITIFFFRFLYKKMEKYVPGFNAEHRLFYIRLIDLIFRVFAFILSVLAVVFVFYLLEDWVLLSISILFLLSIGWAVKNTIPTMLGQGKLIMNAGPVREGERIFLYGVPWLVKRINLFSIIENPSMGVRLRIPLKEFEGKISRSFSNNEPWFPCKKDDWVLLSDQVFGKVISLSHEFVKIIKKGGASKVYKTQEFMDLSPMNFSQGFRIKEKFGISYSLQKEAPKLIPDILVEFIKIVLDEENFFIYLNDLKVELAEAGASSLDLMVIADFKGEAAPFYRRLKRLIQRCCVDACTENNWEIPFPQLTVHHNDNNKYDT